MTAIGKVYKPALRLAALETKLAEVLAPLGVPVQVSGEDRSGRTVAVLRFGGRADAGLEARTRALLTAIAVDTELRFES
jgi:fatty-acyl-CoA synthase